jgi:hypothetical protein
MKGFYNLIDNIKAELETIPFVNTITQGDIYEVDLAKQTIFPLSHIIVNNVNLEGKIMRFNISILAMDIVDINKEDAPNVYVGNDNVQDVLNQQLIVCQRVFESAKRGDLYDDFYQTDGTASCEPFTERFENFLAGWTMTFDVLVPNEMTICD